MRESFTWSRFYRNVTDGRMTFKIAEGKGAFAPTYYGLGGEEHVV